MTFSMRVKVTCILVVSLLLLAGSAWAAQTPAAVAGKITTYDAGFTTAINVNTIEVTGTVSKAVAATNLELGDLAGLTIDWKAALTVTGSTTAEVEIISFENGEFNLLTGGMIQINASGEISAIEAKGSATVRVSGGAVGGNGEAQTGISADRLGHQTEVIVQSGTINFPYGFPIAVNTGNLTIVDSSGITGIVGIGGASDAVGRVFGTTYTTDFNIDNPAIQTVTAIVESGAVWNLEVNALNIKATTTFIVNSGGHLILNGTVDTTKVTELYGTLLNHGKVTNNVTINNRSGKTLDNRGTLTNNGIINNAATGRIRNTGSIDNINGTINNDKGGTFESVQTAEQMGGTINGPVTPISSGGSSSGCNAGFGMIALLLAGFALTRKSRKA